MLAISLIVLIYLIIVELFNQKIGKYELETQAKVAKERLKQYEKMYFNQLNKNIQYKKDLLKIYDLLEETDEQAINYINNIIKIHIDTKQQWIIELEKINSSSLRGFLYYKLLELELENVKINFVIEESYNNEIYKKQGEKIKSKIQELFEICFHKYMKNLKYEKNKEIFLCIKETKNLIIFEIKYPLQKELKSMKITINDKIKVKHINKHNEFIEIIELLK